MPRTRNLIVATLGLLLISPIQAAEKKEWYVVLLAGKKAGWMSAKDYSEKDRRTSSAEVKMALSRGQIAIEIEMAYDFVESLDGKPLSMRLRQVMGQFPQETLVTFESDHLAMRSVQGGVVKEQQFPLPSGEWMTPGRANDYSEKHILEKTPSFSVRTLDPSIGVQPITLEHKLVAASVEVPELKSSDGKPVMGSRWEATIDKMPGIVTTEYYDAEAKLLRTEMPMGGMKIVMVMADRDSVMRDLEAPELMVDTFVRPARAVQRARDTSRTVLVLRARSGDLPDLPTMAGQKVERIEGGMRLTIDAEQCHPAPDEELKDPAFLQASSQLDHENPAIRKLVEQATEGVGEDKSKRAEAMRRFVRNYVEEKSLDTAFATATEVAAKRAGDCSEHGVLLAAMLRADGIPSRVVTGLMYVDRFIGESQIFGYHMWAQALIDGAWVDYDGVLPGHRTDATHIILSTSALNDDSGFVTEMATLALIMGNLEIEVVEVEHRPNP